MGKPDAPTPPNPYQTAGAQTSTNVGTAIANSYLNNVNQNTPNGSLRYDATGQYQFNDPNTNALYTIPTFTATQSLTPQGQQIQNLNQNSQQNLAQIGSNQSAAMIPYLSGGVDANFNTAGYLAANPTLYPGHQLELAAGSN